MKLSSNMMLGRVDSTAQDCDSKCNTWVKMKQQLVQNALRKKSKKYERETYTISSIKMLAQDERRQKSRDKGSEMVLQCRARFQLLRQGRRARTDAASSVNIKHGGPL
jgi:hypothetical protein